MKKSVFFGGMLVLAFVMAVTGCASLFGGKAPSSFVTGSGGETTVLLREGLNFDQAVREVIFVMSRNGFEPEMVQADVGYIRTRWNTTWVTDGKNTESYRVRILINFNPSRTQMIIGAPAEFTSDGKVWKSGYDSKAIQTLRNDLTQSIGN